MPSPHVRDVAEADFQRDALERSFDVPVVVDFWAPWCAPCRTLGPVLERLADEGQGTWLLVKVNVDEAQGLAGQYGIRSIPAVKAFRDGRIVGEFVGGQPEAAIRQFLRQIVPSEADGLAAAGWALLEQGQAAAARAPLDAALALEGRHPRALLGLAAVLGETDAIDDAIRLLDRMPPDTPYSADAERLAAELRTRKDATGDETALRARVAGTPDDLAARIQLGRLLATRRRYEEALAELLVAVQRDPHFDDDAARKAMLDVFTTLGHRHELVERFRAELAKALYR